MPYELLGLGLIIAIPIVILGLYLKNRSVERSARAIAEEMERYIEAEVERRLNAALVNSAPLQVNPSRST